jgi:hypothetical protein
VPRPDGHSFNGEDAETLDHSRRVVVAACAGAGDDDQQVAAAHALRDGTPDRLGLVRDDGQHNRPAADFACLGREHDRVRVVELALPEA